MNAEKADYMYPKPRRISVLALNFAVLTLAVVFFVWINSIAINARKLPQLTDNGINAVIHRVERQQDAYPIYKTAGLWGARVIHLHRFFNMQAYSPKEQFITANFPLQVNGMQSVYERGIDSHSWLFIATRTGLVRTVTTVLPDHVFGELAQKNQNDRIFTYSKGTITGYTYDIPRTISTLDTLPATDEPIIANVDAGFFTGGADPSETAMLLKKKCPDVRMLVLIDSFDEPGVTDAMRGQLQRFEAAWRAVQ